jgi:hypothetical protein
MEPSRRPGSVPAPADRLRTLRVLDAAFLLSGLVLLGIAVALPAIGPRIPALSFAAMNAAVVSPLDSVRARPLGRAARGGGHAVAVAVLVTGDRRPLFVAALPVAALVLRVARGPED